MLRSRHRRGVRYEWSGDSDLLECIFCHGSTGRLADRLDDAVDVCLSEQEAFDGVFAFSCFPQKVLCASANDIDPMADEGIEQHSQSHELWAIPIERKEDHADS